ncbi:MAG: hypothetical protein J7L55_02190 [Desulfurococcales archaeon]|nr:hypothetical protein [Desulfurococcales archaeon]
MVVRMDLLKAPVWLRRKWALILSISVLIIALIVGSHLRLYAVYNAESWGYGPTLNELDPFSEYWIAKNLLEHGINYFGMLTRENPLTHIFWYPWGRDFVRSEPPMLSVLSVLTYYVAHAVNPSLTLYEWMVYLPILFYIMTALGIYFTARELWGDIPAAASTITAALVFVSRHVAGFTVKYAAGLGFFFPAIFFHVRGWKRKSYVSAALGGIFLSFTALSWAGFNILLGIIALQMIFLPFLKEVEKDDIILWSLEAVPLWITLAVTPFYGINYVIRSVGLIIPAIYLLVGIGYFLQKASRKREIIISMPLLKHSSMIYALILALIAVGGFLGLVLGFISLRGKGLAALGLVGLVRGTLVRTVQEYAPASPQSFVSMGGLALIVSILMLIYFAYRALMKKDIIDMFIGFLFAASFYTTIHLSYFFPYFNYVVALVSGSFLYVLLRPSLSGEFRKNWFINTIAILIIVGYMSAVLFQGTTAWARNYEVQTPMLLNSGLGLSVNAPAWVDTLNWLNTSTPRDSVAVAWWDYGYWLSVLGGRASVADGATINGTQIEILAKALTGSEDEALQIFTKDFQIRPDRLYLVAYEVYVVDPQRGLVYVGPIIIRRSIYDRGLYLGADAAKGIAAIYRIAGRAPPVYTMALRYAYVGYSLPDWTNASLRNATLFKMLLYTAYELWGKQGFVAAFPYDPFSSQRPAIIPWPNMTVFEPAHIAISRILDYPETYVVVSVYKVKGTV